MKFTHRLAYYLFGLAMGGFLVSYIFAQRGQDFCYLPNCRVLKDIRSKGIVYSPAAEKELSKKWVTIDDIRNITTHGDVDFSRSNKKEKGGKLYIIEGKTLKGESVEIEVVNFEAKVELKDIKKIQ